MHNTTDGIVPSEGSTSEVVDGHGVGPRASPLSKRCTTHPEHTSGVLHFTVSVLRLTRLARLDRQIPSVRPPQGNAEDDAECCVCHYYCHLGGLVCDCSPARSACFVHAKQMCECEPASRTLVYRFSLKELEDLVAHVRRKLEGPSKLNGAADSKQLAAKLVKENGPGAPPTERVGG
eukprot:1180572-Prorocentrum_minimum.AAC.1